MDARFREMSQPRPECCGGLNRKNRNMKPLSCWENNTVQGNNVCNDERTTKRGKSNSRNQQTVGFYQAIEKVQNRMDSTFRNLEGGLRGVEKSMNDEVAHVLAEVKTFEEGMKPKLLSPYKKCKELESLVKPVLSNAPKRPVTARHRPPPKPDNTKQRSKSTVPKQPTRKGMDRFRELMCSPSLDRVNPWEGSEKQYDPCKNMRREPYENEDDYQSYSSSENTENEVKQTLKELQGISLSVNKSMKRMNDAIMSTDDYDKMKRNVERDPDVLNRVNASLNHIGAGARLMKRLLSEGRMNAN